jgi:anti-sigma factor RsiW
MKRCEDVVPLLGPLADAALADDDREWVEEHLCGCASCRDRLALIVAQGAALREVIAARAAAASFDGLAGRVLARVAEDSGRAPLPVWFSELWSAHRGAFTAAGGLAAAAAVALALLFTPAQPSDEAALLADASAPEVQEVDFGTHDGAVLQLPHDTTVIWMSDDRGVQQ